MSKQSANKPSYLQLKDNLRERIRSGEWKPGEQIPTERELEREFSLSRNTVTKGIASLVSEGYLHRQPGKGTYVAESHGWNGEAGKEVKPRLVKFIAPMGHRGETHIKTHGTLTGIHRTFADSYYEVGLDFYNNHEEQVKLLQQDNDPYFAGFIMFYTPCSDSTEELIRLKAKGFPFVLIDAYPSEVDVDFAVTNNVEGGSQVVEHLAKLGHKRIVYVTRPVDRSSLADRLSGVLKGMVMAGIPFSNDSIVNLPVGGSASYDHVKPIIDKLISQPNPPTAIAFSNDDLALEAITCLRSKAIDVPKDISVIGYDNIDRAEYSEVPLTTVAQDFYEMGINAAEMLLRKLQDEAGLRPELEQVFLKPQLTIRASTASLKE